MLVNCNMMMGDCYSCRSVRGMVFCHADEAVLCGSCGAEVHSANLISHRHRRVPVVEVVNQDEENDGDGSGCNYEALFGDHEVDEYLDLGEFNNSCGDEKGGFTLSVKDEVSEGVVPVVQHEAVGFGYSASMRLGVSLSSMEANSIVPDTTTMADISSSHVRASKGTIELFSSPPIQIPTQFSPLDREARVLRYREKKKTRKFEKTIRYASRKAYAEARPRIKGRFAKRSEVEMEVDQMFSNYVVNKDGYGLVPSF